VSGPGSGFEPIQLVPPPLLENAQAEQAVLGMLLARVELVDYLPLWFHVTHFADEWHRELFEALRVARADGQVGAVAVNLISTLGITEPDKRTYLSKLLSAFVSLTPAALRGHASAVTDMWKRRVTYDAGRKVTEAAVSSLKAPIDGALAALIMDLTDTAEQISEANDTDALSSTDVMLNESDEVRANQHQMMGLTTGMRSIDRRLGGLEPGTMTILGGRPGMGKTSLGMQWAVNAALAGAKVAVFSLEMTKVQLARRIISWLANVPSRLIREGRFDAEQGSRIVEARNRLANIELRIDDGGGLSVGEIQLRARRMARRMGGGLDLIVVDHLHIVKPEATDVRAGATWAVGRVSSGMKAIGKQTGAAMLVLAQLNRGVEGRDDKRPTMADLRQAGDIEQDADAICFLYRGEYYLSADAPERRQGESQDDHQKKVTAWEEARARLRGIAELICPKVRDGEPGHVTLHFNGPTTSFSELARDAT
jgi:replicative DNA helicase